MLSCVNSVYCPIDHPPKTTGNMDLFVLILPFMVMVCVYCSKKEMDRSVTAIIALNYHSGKMQTFNMYT